MSFAGQLYETAGRLAKYAQSSAAALEEERLQIEMRKREVEAQLDAANFAHKRLATLYRYAGPTFNVPAAGLITEQPPTSRRPQKTGAAQRTSGAAHATSNLPCARDRSAEGALMRKSLIVNLSLAAALSLGSTSGLAANISLAPLDGDPAHAIVVVEGRLESGDEIQFRTQVGRLTRLS
jgi:hypothetical protein